MNRHRHCIALIALLLFKLLALAAPALAQEARTQTVKGRLLDAQSDYPLVGATVVLVGSEPQVGAVTDSDGYYRIENVPLGRVTLRFAYVGYEEKVVPNVTVAAGKETVMNLKLEESLEMLSEIVVTDEPDDRTAPMNEMASVSARTFDMGETARYAGSRNDPARMAQNFAGVAGGNDQRNDVIVRGNSPTGVLWRLEGLDIPNPNHFGSFGTTGGPVSMLNNNVLANSEFMTGAFPAEYGNALSGVFDLQMRTGNQEKREYLGQIGFNGFELGAEGPFSKDSRASYLVNYRYSTLAVFDALGISFGTGSAVPYYQDLSFNFDLPGTKAGRFTLFGLGGVSNIDLLGSDIDGEAAEDDLFGNINEDSRNVFRTGVVGLKHQIFLNENAYWRNTLAVSGSLNDIDVDTVVRRREDLEVLGAFDQLDIQRDQLKYTWNTLFNVKLSAKNTFSAGAILDLYDLSFQETPLMDFQDPNAPGQTLTYQGREEAFANFSGQMWLLQAYAMWQHRFNDKLTLNTGLHYQRLTLNGSQAIEPRAGLRYKLRENMSLNLGYGRHSQIQAPQVYFAETRYEDGATENTNEDLGFTNADHFVVGYDWAIGPNLRLKAETYYQYLSDVPVDPTEPTFSMLNAGADFILPDNDDLLNEGTGVNYGVELTVEKFFSDDYYFLITTSLFESKYEGYDGVERNTAFNGNYVVNVLAGKEWPVGKKGDAVVADLNLTAAGNRRYVPVDVDASNAAGFEVFDYANAYQDRYRDYFRADLKVGYRIEGKRLTQEWSVDVQNLTNRDNVFTRDYNALTGQIGTTSQLGLFPVVQYRALF